MLVRDETHLELGMKLPLARILHEKGGESSINPNVDDYLGLNKKVSIFLKYAHNDVKDLRVPEWSCKMNTIRLNLLKIDAV